MNKHAQTSNPSNFFGGGPYAASSKLNINAMQPLIDEQGRTYIVNDDGSKNYNMVTNAGSLMYDEFKDLNYEVVRIARERLVGVQDLRDSGLTHNLGSIGKTISQWEEVSDMTDADVNMSGVSAGEEDAINYDQAQVPVPIIHKDFRLNIRPLESSRIFGESLDVTAGTTAARKVAEKSEDMLFAGEAINVNGNTIYGYTNYPGRNTETLSTAWDSVTDNQDIIDDALTMLDAARADNYTGPFTLYIPQGYEGVLDEDFKPGSGDTRTVRERLLQLSNLDRIVVADRLASDNVVLVQLTRDVVDLAIAQDVTTVQWDSQGGMQEHFKVMAVWVPRLKSDYDGKTGIVHLS